MPTKPLSNMPADQSRDAEALHSLGLQAICAGLYPEAAQLLRKAIAIEPMAPYHGNLGVALQKSGNLEGAALEYGEALRLDPNFADAASNLGSALYELKRFEEALPHLEAAVTLNPSHAAAHLNLGVTLHALGRTVDGLSHAHQAVQLNPCEDTILKFAGLLIESAHGADGIPYFHGLIARNPSNPAAYQALGDCYVSQSLLREAAPHYWKTLQLKPDAPRAANNLGLCLAEAGFQAEAVPLYRRALEIRPDDAHVWTNLGLALHDLGETDASLECQNRALALQPGYPKALLNRSLCLLEKGKMAEGWADYERRFEAHESSGRPFTQPRWDGSDPAGKRILVWMEQGIGDQILWAGLLPDLLRRGAHCVLETESRLVSLLARSLPGIEVVPRGNPPHPLTSQPTIDFQIPAGSLPLWFRPDLESFPKHSGYLVSDPVLVSGWSRRLADLGPSLKVGICWRSMLHRDARSIFYSQLRKWGPILTVPGIDFINLQYDQCDEELQEAERLFGTRIHIWDGVDLMNDLETVAALISKLDLIIGAPTAVTQMGGALGVPTWVMARGPRKLYSLGTEHCPWFPSTRLFACKVRDPWEPLIEIVGRALSSLKEVSE
jgi:tetratricopeptide (TPR) repeat protein